MSNQEQDPIAEAQLIEDMAGYSKDPYGWVMYSFPWGEGSLAEYNGPDEWQKEILIAIRDGLITVNEAIRIAVSSGHGIGKSALVAWLILWSLSTFEDTRGVVTANTATQLSTKTWVELSKWHQMFIAKHWFTLTATSIFSVDPEHERTWRIDAIPWSEHRSEAFAGMHNKGKRIIIIFDEASAIADKIWEVTEGALTDEDTEILWFAFGNPTRNTGRFKECWGIFRARWKQFIIDSRKAKMTNKKQIQQWIDDFGIDSDFVKVRVRGLFPNASDYQFIPNNVVDKARGRTANAGSYNFAPKILSLDNAWTGGDKVVIGIRQGIAYRILATYTKNDNDAVIAGALAKFEDQEDADAVFIDMGYGTGVYSFGKTINRKWILVPFGSKSNSAGFLNKRAEMWGLMKKWLEEGGCIPDHQELYDDLVGPEAYPTLKGEIYLESKEDMRARGLSSPNYGDNLALTFAFPVVRKIKVSEPPVPGMSYDPLNQKSRRAQEYDALG